MAAPPPTPPPLPPPLLLRRVLSLDTKLSHFLHRLFHPFLPPFLLLLLEFSADFRFFFPVFLSLFLSLPYSPPLRRLSPFLLSLLLGLLLDLALVGLVKVLFRRRRPPYNPNMSPVVSADNFSFPSGHASRVCFVASLVFLFAEPIQAAVAEWRNGGGGGGGGGGWIVEVLVVIVCVWAGMTAASRVLLGRHFLLDVLAGACLGVLEGLFAFRFFGFDNISSILFYQKVGQGRS